MLARRICHYNARTPLLLLLPRPTPRVPCLLSSRRRRRCCYTTAAQPVDGGDSALLAEPVLNWAAGAQVLEAQEFFSPEDAIPEEEAVQINPQRQPRRGHKPDADADADADADLPLLPSWAPNQRLYNTPPIELSSIRGLLPKWLPSNRDGPQLRLNWKPNSVGNEFVALLVKAELETRAKLIKRITPRARSSIVTRSQTAAPRPAQRQDARIIIGRPTARKVISSVRNASEVLAAPKIVIGRQVNTAQNPRPVPWDRLSADPFASSVIRRVVVGHTNTRDRAREKHRKAAGQMDLDTAAGAVGEEGDIERIWTPDMKQDTQSTNDTPMTNADTHATTRGATPPAAKSPTFSPKKRVSPTPTSPKIHASNLHTSSGPSNPELKRLHSPPKKAPHPPKKQRRAPAPKPNKDGSPADILSYDITTLLTLHNLPLPSPTTPTTHLPERSTTLQLSIHSLSSVGDGLAVHDGRVYVVPFTLPGDTIKASVRGNQPTHSIATLLEVLTPSPDRDDSLVKCQYFASCSGCQFQMLPYHKQLEHKQRVVSKAFAHYSGLPAEALPGVLPTMGSPLEYGYRTKLTPHFNGPRRGGFKPGFPVPSIGFMEKSGRRVLDIEDCPIATEAVREGMKTQRAWVKENLFTFKRGATILLRESTERVPVVAEGSADAEQQGGGASVEYVETKKCVTKAKEKSREYFGDFKFDSPAGSFFQNNNSILAPFTDYIRANLALPIPSSTSETTAPKHLVDAYCGSGLFTVACGQNLDSVIGIDIDPASIESARTNARLNNITNATFLTGNAEAIFAKITFPGAETSLIIDPPRKGCDNAFLDQLLEFAPKRIVYVSCNVHTQARDIGYILRDKRGKGYKVDSIKGFDFFPQTHHVEGVAVLTRAD